MSILDFHPILQTRRNHALEHASLHILAQRHPQRQFGGHSNPTGFIIFGEAPLEDIRDSVDQALTRLRAGETQLAIHPGCGTNYATSALVGGMLGWLAISGAKSRRGWLWRLPFAILLSILGFVLAQPLGPALQARFTTEPNPGNLEVVEIKSINLFGQTIHQISTRGIV